MNILHILQRYKDLPKDTYFIPQAKKYKGVCFMKINEFESVNENGVGQFMPENTVVKQVMNPPGLLYHSYKIEERALRYNDGKPEYSLLPLDCLEPAVKVLMYGAKKYSRDNWRKGLDKNKIIDSLLRHIRDLQKGILIDEESGESVIGHIQCNAIFLGNPSNFEDE